MFDESLSTQSTTAYNLSYTKTVALKAGDVVEIKGDMFGWATDNGPFKDPNNYNATPVGMKGYFQNLNVSLNSKYTDIGITKI
jgi:hypothetical protein